MSKMWYILVGLWIFMFVFPEFLSYIIWGLFLFIWLNILFFKFSVNKNNNSTNKDKDWVFMQIGNYKIYK